MLASVKAPVVALEIVNVPTEPDVPSVPFGPGLISPPAFTFTVPPIVPVPPNVPLLLTATAPVPVPKPVVLFTNNVPALTVVVPVYKLAPERARVPLPALVNPVAVLLLITPVIDVSVVAVPSLIVKVRVTPVVAVLLRLILPLIVAVPLALASNVIPTPLVVALEKAMLTEAGIVAAPCICKVVAVLLASVKV